MNVRLCTYYFPLEASAADINKIKAIVANEQAVVVGTYNLSRNKAWADLVNSLEQNKLIVLAMRSPYDLMAVPKLVHILPHMLISLLLPGQLPSF